MGWKTSRAIKSTLGCTNNRKEQALMFDVVDLDESCNEDLLESINVQQFSFARNLAWLERNILFLQDYAVG